MILGKVVALAAFAMYQGEARSPFTGDGVHGGGRVCNTGVRVYPKYIDWDTTYSNCKHTPYDILEKSQSHFVYRLKPKTKSCKFRILIVERDVEMQAWGLIGYGTESAWRKNDSAEELPCGPLF